MLKTEKIKIVGQSLYKSGAFKVFAVGFAVGILAITGSYLRGSKAATTNKKVGVIVFRFSDESTAAAVPSNDEVKNVLYNGPSSINNFWKENSYNKYSISGKINAAGDVYGPYTLPNPASTYTISGGYGCDYNRIASDAKSYAASAGNDMSGYDFYVYIFPGWNGTDTCNFGGLGGGGTVWAHYYTPRILADLLNHELGHVFGMAHSGVYECKENGVKVAFSQPSNCVHNPNYYDAYDPNSHFKHNSNWQKVNNMGISLPSQAVTTSGEYTLAPLEQSTSGVQMLSIAMNNGKQLYLEYRQPIGFDGPNTHPDSETYKSLGDPVYKGVIIRVAPFSGQNIGDRSTGLVDTTPNSSTGQADWSDAALAVGHTFTDSVDNISIQTLSADSTSARVKITLGSGPSPPPSQPPAPTLSSHCSGANSIVDVSFNTATTPVSVDMDYNNFTDGQWWYKYPQYSSPLYNAPQSFSQYYTSEVAPTSLTPGRAYQVRIWNGSQYSATGTFTAVSCLAADTIPPKVLITYPAYGQQVNGFVTMSANITDNIKVSMVQFYLDGVLTKTLYGPPYQWYTDTRKFANGGHNLVVKAVDSSNNVGQSLEYFYISNYSANDTTAPKASLSAPANSSYVKGTVNIAGVASDDRSVTKTELYIDGSLKYFVGSGSFNYSWNTTGEAAGSHTIYLKAYDAAGNVGTSPEVKVNKDIVAPTVNISQPSNNAFIRGSYQNIYASASDNNKVARMEIYIDGKFMGSSNSSSIYYSWYSRYAANGSHYIMVKAYDGAGNVSIKQVRVYKYYF